MTAPTKRARRGSSSRARGNYGQALVVRLVRGHGYEWKTNAQAAYQSQGAVDGVATRADLAGPLAVLFVQCKRWASKDRPSLRPAEHNELYDEAELRGGTAVFAVVRPGVAENAAGRRQPMLVVELYRLTGRKAGTLGQRQPIEPLILPEV
jgi:hypothetical protein